MPYLESGIDQKIGDIRCQTGLMFNSDAVAEQIHVDLIDAAQWVQSILSMRDTGAAV